VHEGLIRIPRNNFFLRALDVPGIPEGHLGEHVVAPMSGVDSTRHEALVERNCVFDVYRADPTCAQVFSILQSRAVRW
jgi:hypothetical protein